MAKSPVKKHDRDVLTRSIKAGKQAADEKKLTPLGEQFQLIQKYPDDEVVADEMFDTLTEAIIEGTLALRQGKNISINRVDLDA